MSKSDPEARLVRAAEDGFASLLREAGGDPSRLVDDVGLARRLALSLERSGDRCGALHLAGSIAQRHPRNRRATAFAIRLLRRRRAFGPAMEVLDTILATRRGTARSALLCAKRDILRAFGVGLADAADAGPASRGTGPIPRSAQDRLSSCCAALLSGERARGRTLYRSILSAVREASSSPHSTSSGRIREAEQLSERFREATEDVADPALEVLLLADSIAMPRDAEGLGLRDVYAFELHRQLHSRTGGGVALLAERGQTAPEALGKLASAGRPCGAIVVQIGLVDAFPRAHRIDDLARLSSAYGPEAARTMAALGRAYRHVLEGEVYVPVAAFERALSRIVLDARRWTDAVVLTTIITPARRCGRDATRVGRNVARYNRTIARVASRRSVPLVDLDAAIWSRPEAAAFFVADNQHPNAEGHRIIADALLAELEPILRSRKGYAARSQTAGASPLAASLAT